MKIGPTQTFASISTKTIRAALIDLVTADNFQDYNRNIKEMEITIDKNIVNQGINCFFSVDENGDSLLDNAAKLPKMFQQNEGTIKAISSGLRELLIVKMSAKGITRQRFEAEVQANRTRKQPTLSLPAPATSLTKNSTEEALLSSQLAKLTINDKPIPRANQSITSKGRSPGAQQIHRALMACCNAKDENGFETKIQALGNIIDTQAADCLLEVSVNKFSHIDDALHLPIELQQDKTFAQLISTKLFDLLIAKIQSKNISFSLFAQKILANITNDGFMPLQQALASGNPVIALKVIKLLQAPGCEAILIDNLKNRANDGFMPLQGALKSGNLELALGVIALSEEHLPFKDWKIALKAHNKHNYNLLHQAAMINNFELFMSVIYAIRKAFSNDSEQVITQLANEKTNKGFLSSSRQCREIEDFLRPFRQQQETINAPASGARSQSYTPHYNNNNARSRGRGKMHIGNSPSPRAKHTTTGKSHNQTKRMDHRDLSNKNGRRIPLMKSS